MSELKSIQKAVIEQGQKLLSTRQEIDDTHSLLHAQGEKLRHVQIENTALKQKLTYLEDLFQKSMSKLTIQEQESAELRGKLAKAAELLLLLREHMMVENENRRLKMKPAALE